jgi:hypothetical protein
VAVARADARMDLRAITLPMAPDAALNQTRRPKRRADPGAALTQALR